MGESFGYGMRRAIGEVVAGIVTSVLVGAFVSSGLLPPAYAVLFGILNMLGTVTLILAMPYWGTVYLFGWLLGLFIMLQTGLVGILDVLVDFGVPFVVWVWRIWKELT